MQIVIHSIKMPVLHTENDVIEAAQNIVRLRCVSAKDFKIYKQSIDARKKREIHYVYSVTAEAADSTVCDGKVISELKTEGEIIIPCKTLKYRPVVVGTGPCGLFAAYILAKSGNAPIVLERGEDIDKRAKTVSDFWNGGTLNENSNIQFGEGGAGTFSDGKLNTRISDPSQKYVLKTFAEHGAPEDILYKAKPHIGTDKLRSVIKSMREEIIREGGEVRFGSCLTGIKCRDGKICEIEVNHSETISCSDMILAIGHSSRDTYKMIADTGIFMEPKPFAAGVRIEHKQRMIDCAQYGSADLGLPPADYRLVYNGKDRSCYSFCMCPGGQVVNASSENGRLVVNGMSEHSRDGENANSALVVSVRPSDFSEAGPLGGIAFQRIYEEAAYALGGGDGSAPIQMSRDFLAKRVSAELDTVVPSFTGKVRMADLSNCLPEFITSTLREGLIDFEHKIKGFSLGNAVMTGVEMRTSAPLRIVRNENLQSISAAGLYPAGEGAGYAGGIGSAAVDGIRCALAVLGEK